MGSLLLSSLSWYVQNFVCALQDWSLPLPQAPGSPVIKSHCPARSACMGIPSPFIRSPGCEAWCGVQNLHNNAGTSLVFLFSSVWVTCAVGMGFDFVMIAPLLPSHWSFFLAFGHGVSYFDGFLYPPIDGCSTASCSFGALTGGDECMSFYSTILNQKLKPQLLF